MKVKIICIEGYWNDEPEFDIERRCAVLPEGVTDAQRKAIFEELTDEVFYFFEHNEPIVGKHFDFTVTFYNPIREMDFGSQA